MGLTAGPGRGARRARRHLLVAGFVLGYLAAGGVALAIGDRAVGGGWLAVHLVLLGIVAVLAGVVVLADAGLAFQRRPVALAGLATMAAATPPATDGIQLRRVGRSTWSS